MLRSVPLGGQGYSLLKYYNKSGTVKKNLDFTPTLIYKHLGQVQDWEIKNTKDVDELLLSNYVLNVPLKILFQFQN